MSVSQKYVLQGNHTEVSDKSFPALCFKAIKENLENNGTRSDKQKCKYKRNPVTETPTLEKRERRRTTEGEMLIIQQTFGCQREKERGLSGS